MKKLNPSLLLILFPALLLLQACSPNPVFRMSPVAENTSWLSGREYVTSEQDSIVVVLAYYRHMGNLIYFDLEVVNLSDSPFHVDPGQFRYAARDISSDSENVPTYSMMAVNPEDRLLDIDLASSQISADRRTTAGFDAAFLTLGIVSDVAAVANGASSQEMSWRASDRVDLVIDMEIRDERFRRSIDDLAEARNIWELDMLRKTDLRPDEYVRGMVAFPNRETARIYDFTFEIDETEHLFRYEQFRFKP